MKNNRTVRLLNCAVSISKLRDNEVLFDKVETDKVDFSDLYKSISKWWEKEID